MKAARPRRRSAPHRSAPRGLDRATVDLVCTALGEISDRLAVAHLTGLALATAFEARAADRDCVRCLRLAVTEPLHQQLHILRNLAREIPLSLDRRAGPANGSQPSFGECAAGRAL